MRPQTINHTGNQFEEIILTGRPLALSGYRYCIEIRNQNYLNKRYFEFLNSMNLSHVFLQGYWMPPIFEIYGRFSKYIKHYTVNNHYEGSAPKTIVKIMRLLENDLYYSVEL